MKIKMDVEENKTENEDKSNKAFDLLDYIGEIGVYQITLFLLLGTMEYFGVDSLTINFTAGHMDHWCLVETIQDFSHDQQKYIAIPYENGQNIDEGYQECNKFNLNYNNYTDEQYYNWNRTAMTDHNDLTSCDGMWVYDQSEFYSTIVSRWDLVCDKVWLTSMVSTIYMAGRLVGALCCGFISDGWGRIWGILVFTGVRFLGALLSLYAGSYGVFVTGRFVVAVGSTAANLCAFVMICEVSGSKYRGWFGALWQCIFSLAYAVLPFYAYFIRDDQKLQSVLTWPLLIQFIIVVFANSLVYSGLSLNAASLPGNVYVTTFLYGISEIPANLFGIYIMNKIGRMWTIAFSILFGGACSFLVVFFILFGAPPEAITTFAVLGKMGISISFTTAYVYAVEIFPTPLRINGVGSSSMCARISGMIAPFMGEPLIAVWEPLPHIIFGIFATLSGFTMMLLPETLNRKLPETIEEAEAFGKKTKPAKVSPIATTNGSEMESPEQNGDDTTKATFDNENYKQDHAFKV